MTTSDKGLEFIKDREGVINRVYLDPVGLPTVGVGHLVTPEDGLMVGDLISESLALELLRKDLAKAEAAVLKAVKVPLSQNQFDALVSFVFNVGASNFRTSTLLRHLNAFNYTAAADEFPKWANAGGRRLPGLVRRRADERALFLR